VLASTLACALIPIVLCIAAGSAIRSPSDWPGSDMLVGFGLLSSALSILAVTMRLPLSWLMACLAALSMMALLMRRRCPGGRSTWIALVLVLPILVGAAGSRAAMWDDFWNWLPSAAYAYGHDSLVWPDLPPSFSIFPGYPQGVLYRLVQLDQDAQGAPGNASDGGGIDDQAYGHGGRGTPDRSRGNAGHYSAASGFVRLATIKLRHDRNVGSGSV
jgi:hypothetical protein